MTLPPIRRTTPGPKLAAAAAGVLCLLLFSLSHLGIQTTDDIATLASAGALWDEHTLAIPHLAAFDEQVDIGRQGRGGHLYSKYGLAQTLLAAALYGLGDTLLPGAGAFEWGGHTVAGSAAGAAAAEAVNVLLGSLTVAVVVHELARRSGLRVAAAGGVMLAAASPLWLASRGFGTESGAAFALLLAAVSARRALSGEGSPLWPAAAWVGVAALFRPSALAFAPALLAWLWKRPRGEWLATAGVLAAALAALLGYNWLRFGALFESGYGDGGSSFALHLGGLAGFLAASGRSLLLFAPWTLLLAPAVRRVPRAESTWALGTLAGIIAFFAAHCLWREWHGGWAYGPRLLVPLLPVIALLVSEELLRFPRASLLMFALGSLLQALTLPFDPLLTHRAVIGSLITFEQSVWSPAHSITVQQVKAAAASGQVLWVVLWAALLAGWLFVLTATPPRPLEPAQE